MKTTAIIKNSIVISSVLPSPRKFVKKGRVLTIDTGGGQASISDFDINKLRNKKL